MESERKTEYAGYILVVEKDDLIADLLDCWLAEAGYTVVAGTYEMRRREDEPRLVIANLSSPRGAEALIHALQAVYSAPILALSARFRAGLGSSLEAAQRLGVTKVLPKPFSRNELLGAVRECMNSP
ncbi:MAG TPA: response regulator [Burkholderiales bacterium]|jgi:DNA-binding response OmpR family regulator|nr:response regulator [Burkholderiales bacterium]